MKNLIVALALSLGTVSTYAWADSVSELANIRARAVLDRVAEYDGMIKEAKVKIRELEQYARKEGSGNPLTGGNMIFDTPAHYQGWEGWTARFYDLTEQREKLLMPQAVTCPKP